MHTRADPLARAARTGVPAPPARAASTAAAVGVAAVPIPALAAVAAIPIAALPITTARRRVVLGWIRPRRMLSFIPAARAARILALVRIHRRTSRRT